MKIFEKLFISGRWGKPSGSQTIDVINPYTEKPCGRVPSGAAGDVQKAVRAARNAFDGWAATAPLERAAAIEMIAAGIERRKEEFARTISSELGMPIKFAKSIQSELPAAEMRSYAGLLREAELQEQVGNSLIIKEPVGVCAFITPWNYPLHQIVGKVAPALAAGCTVVLKPSSQTPLNAFIFAEIIAEVGLPPGVFNLVSGSGREVGEELCRHPDVDLVSFTGSTGAGKRISALAAESVKRVTLELGGKSANIILPDADLAKAVAHGVKSIFLNSGQTCSALARMLVPADRRAEAIAVARNVAAEIAVGDPSDPNTFMGPVVSAKQRETVRSYIRKGIEEGAGLICGGVEPPEHLQQGYFVAPTIFADVANEMTIAKEEIFGPVLCIIPYTDEDEAVRIANDTIYGLSGAVWAGSQEHALNIARRLRTGQVAINGGRHNILAPFGGYKQSGRGREFGKFGLEEFLEIKSIQL